MYLALFYETVDHYVERRQPFRELHLKYATEWREQGKLVLGGALKPDGALLVFKSDNPDDAANFAKNDPYVKNGLISKWSVKEWVVVIGTKFD